MRWPGGAGKQARESLRAWQGHSSSTSPSQSLSSPSHSSSVGSVCPAQSAQVPSSLQVCVPAEHSPSSVPHASPTRGSVLTGRHPNRYGTFWPGCSLRPEEITVAQLLGHTSGLTQYRDEAEIENTIHYHSLQEAMEVFIDRPLLFPPGTQYFYTTYGYVVLGRIIETVSGMPYEAYMQHFIFEPAGMTVTYAETMD